MATVNSVTNAVFNADIFPFFEIVHNFLAASEVRNELGENGQKFSRNCPFASWIITVAFIFSGSITANILLGDPPIGAALGNTKLLMVASAIWYFVFFAPFDVGYKAVKLFPIRLVASIFNEIYRIRKIGNGILQASKIYPDSWVIMIAIAVIRANGSGLMKLLIRQMQNTQSSSSLQLPITTKMSMIAAFLFILEKRISWLEFFDLLYFGITIFFIYIKICSFFKPVHHLLPLESKCYSLLFNNNLREKEN